MKASNKNLTETRNEYEHEVRNFTGEIYTYVSDFVNSKKVQDTRGNATEIVTDFLNGLKKVAQNQDQIEEELNKIVSAFFEELLVKQKDADGNDILKWKGDMKRRVRNFLDSMKNVGANEDGTTQSVYDLVTIFTQEMTDFANATLQDVTSNMYDIETLQSAIMKVLKDGEDEGFDRAVIEHEFASILEELALLAGREVTALEDVHQAMEWIDAQLSVLLGSSNETVAIPASFYVAPLVMVDSLLEQWNYTTEMSIYQAFGHISEYLGGSNYGLDGFVGFYAKALNIDFGAMAVEFDDIELVTNRGTIFNIDETYSFKFSLDKLASYIPNSTHVNIHFDIYSKTSLLHNASSPHAVAVFNQAYMENLFKQCKGDISSRTVLTSVNHPLPLTTRQSLEIKVMLSVLAGLFILIPYCYIPASFIVFIVRERVSKSKHLQLVSGVNLTAYWIANYLWDITLYLILTLCIMLVFFMYGEKADVFVGTGEAFLATFLLTFGYGLSSLPFAYGLSRMFGKYDVRWKNDHSQNKTDVCGKSISSSHHHSFIFHTIDNSSTAQISVAGIGWLTGFVTCIAYITMNALEKTYHIAEALLPFFRLFPAYHVGEGIMTLSEAFWQREIAGNPSSPLDWDVAGLNICYIFLLAIPYFFIVLALEYSDDGGAGGLLGRLIRGLASLYTKLALRWYGIRTTAGESDDAQYALLGDGDKETSVDSDVLEERAHVLKNKRELKQSASVLLINLWKVYPPSVGIIGSLLYSLRRMIASVLCCCCGKSDVINEDSDNEAPKTYSPKQAVRGVSTAINRGETYALLGGKCNSVQTSSCRHVFFYNLTFGTPLVKFLNKS